MFGSDDKTFCVGTHCYKTATCDRWIGHVKESVRVSLADFSEPTHAALSGAVGTQCAWYQPKEEECEKLKPKRSVRAVKPRKRRSRK